MVHPRSAGAGGCRRAAVGAFEPCRTLVERRLGWGASSPLTVLWAPCSPSRTGSTRPNPLPSFPSRPATTAGSCSNTSNQPSPSARRYKRRLLSRVTRGSRSYPMIHGSGRCADVGARSARKQSRSPLLDRKSTRLNSSHLVISYAVFCLKKKKKEDTNQRRRDEKT